MKKLALAATFLVGCGGGTGVTPADMMDGSVAAPDAAVAPPDGAPVDSGPGERCGDGGAPDECGCTADSMSTTCSGTCGTVTNNCGESVDCGACSASIPPTLFGTSIVYYLDWPIIPFGEMGKPSATKWVYLEQERGVYDWTSLDRYVTQAAENGVPIMWTHVQAPPWAVGGDTDCSQPSNFSLPECDCRVSFNGSDIECSGAVTDLDGLSDFIEALVTRYNGENGHGRIYAYELYNEPDNFFSGGMANLVAQANTIHDAVRAADPTALVVGIGLDFPDVYFDGPDSYMDQFWSMGGTTDLDAVTFHSYPHHDNDTPFDDPTTDHAPEKTTPLYVPIIQASMARHGVSATVPIWDTEGGWGDQSSYEFNDETEQAAWVARDYLLHVAAGVMHFDWYAYDNRDWGTLWSSEGGLTAAGVAYGQTYDWLVGATMSSPCAASGTVYTCALTRPDGYRALAVWNVGGDSQYTPPAEYVSYRDLVGETHAISAGSSITIGIEPVLLENR